MKPKPLDHLKTSDRDVDVYDQDFEWSVKWSFKDEEKEEDDIEKFPEFLQELERL